MIGKSWSGPGNDRVWPTRAGRCRGYPSRCPRWQYVEHLVCVGRLVAGCRVAGELLEQVRSVSEKWPRCAGWCSSWQIVEHLVCTGRSELMITGPMSPRSRTQHGNKDEIACRGRELGRDRLPRTRTGTGTWTGTRDEIRADPEKHEILEQGRDRRAPVRELPSKHENSSRSTRTGPSRWTRTPRNTRSGDENDDEQCSPAMNSVLRQ